LHSPSFKDLLKWAKKHDKQTLELKSIVWRLFNTLEKMEEQGKRP